MVPAGYTARVLIAWGDPVSDGPEFKPDARNTAFEQEWQWGMHNDGLVYFPIHGSARGLVVQNHEYTDDELLFPDGTANWDEEKTKKSLAAHGSTVVGDKYGSPDGLYVAPSGRLWIQTDVSGSTINSGAYAGFGNNQMLCADPHTRKTRRFLVGPNICEVTGS